VSLLSSKNKSIRDSGSEREKEREKEREIRSDRTGDDLSVVGPAKRERVVTQVRGEHTERAGERESVCVCV